ncbi:GDP-D-glucose phosphorylase 1 isoform X2 [Frankliniella occidentalis]|uniref:GDP-D-glucose phosphorylase 1 n=1 Tax=Frankliniella occidentalis TaxID=133901 RepID=A0A9C6X1S9_FRAOC|nr:GDP-D-glucose phosphorylase 1 isoform X2 [Frankliniella occidentalis]
MPDTLQIHPNDVVSRVSWNIEDSRRASNLSSFDNKLLSEWAKAVKSGYFRYALNIQGSVVLPGKWKFFKELNIERGEKVRKPQEFYSVNEPFNKDLFNFTRMKKEEIIFEIQMVEAEDHLFERDDYMAINVSPISEGHCLVLPSIKKMYPQSLTLNSIEMGLGLLLRSSSPSFRVAFNSLCGSASVNHLHLHSLYDLEVVEGPCYQMVNYPARGFAFQGKADSSDDVKSIARNVYKLTNFLQSQNEAHNVTMTRSKLNESDRDLLYVRVYVWVRKPNKGAKETSDFNPAALELFGYFTFKNEDHYKNADEEYLCNVLADLTHEPFQRNFEKVKQLFQ